MQIGHLSRAHALQIFDLLGTGIKSKICWESNLTPFPIRGIKSDPAKSSICKTSFPNKSVVHQSPVANLRFARQVQRPNQRFVRGQICKTFAHDVQIEDLQPVIGARDGDLQIEDLFGDRFVKPSSPSPPFPVGDEGEAVGVRCQICTC